MKKLMLFLVIGLVHGVYGMGFPVTSEIKKNMKDAEPYITLHPRHPKPSVKDCHDFYRVIIGQVSKVGYRNYYLRFTTDDQIDQLVSQIPETPQMHTGEIWSIRWYHYDYPTISACEDDEFKDAKTK